MNTIKYPNLVKEMAVRKITNTAIAELLNIHINSVSYKLSKGTFSIEECIKVRDKYFPDMKIEYLFKTE
ncbi:MAG: hypothetical protein UCH84_06075 [Eubacterium sp.]|nr:hypothetical protein [Eubacterium sp.]